MQINMATTKVTLKIQCTVCKGEGLLPDTRPPNHAGPHIGFSNGRGGKFVRCPGCSSNPTMPGRGYEEKDVTLQELYNIFMGRSVESNAHS